MADETKPKITILDDLDNDEPDTPPEPVSAPVDDGDGWAAEGGGDGWTENSNEEPAAAADEEAPKRRGRKKSDAPTAEASEKSEDTTYVVQRGFTVEGKTYHPGDTIMVKCKYCALWKKEWGGKVRCHPEKEWDDGTKMSADKYSCESFFICKELEPELDNFLSMDHREVLTVRHMLTAAKHLLATELWVNKKYADEDGANPFAIFLNAKGFITSFTNVDQLDLSEAFIRTYANIMADRAKMAARSRKTRAPKIKFGRGDWVEWTDTVTQQQVKGIILYSSKGNIHIAGIDGVSAGQTMTFPTKEWKEKMAPKILKKASSTDVL